jgi:hypothetical protein
MDSPREVNQEHHHHHPGHAHEAGQLTEYPPQGQLTRHRPSREQLTHIQGWGADLDLKNRPAVPMERTPPRFIPQVPPPEQQPQRVEVFVSPERPGITPIFGTAEPPSGLSGMIRRAAYKLTENDIRHWLLLVAADRVNVVEGIGQDLMHGRVPNVLGEMGIRAEMKHNPAGLVKKALVTTAVVGAAWYLMTGRRGR